MADIKDIKLGNTKYNIKIPSSRVKSMADYAKPSSKPSPEAIQQSDTLNAALGKLEYKADTDQTNILYALQTGANNLLDLSNATMSADLSLTVTKDGNSYVVSGNPSTSVQVTFTDFVPCVPPTGSKIAVVGCPSGGSTQDGYSLRGYLDSFWRCTDTGSDTKEFTTSSINKIVFYFVGGKRYTNVRFTPMVVTEEVWNTLGSDYRAPALPNSDLTGLQAEDRAELVELVDSGAKNLLQLPPISTWTINSNITATVSGNEVTVTRASSSSTAGVEIPLTQTIPTNTWVVLSGCPANGSDTTYRIDAFDNGTLIDASVDRGTGSTAFKFSTTTQKIRIRFAANTSYTNLKFQLMLCTKAAFGVSKAFVPYRPNYDLISYLAGAGGFKDSAHGGGIANVDLNAISVTSFTAYNNPTNLPTGLSGWCYVRTYVYDTNGALQELFMIRTNPVSYFRIKSSGTWSAWIQTSTAS